MMKGLILVSFALVTMANAICPCADSTRPSCKDESKPRPVPTCKDGNRPVCSNDKPPAKPTCNGIALSESLVCQDGSPLNTTSFPPCTDWKKPKCKDGSKVLCEDGSRPGRPRFGRPLCPCEDGVSKVLCADGSRPGRRQPWTRPGFGRPGIFGGFGRPGVFGGRPGPFGK